MQGIWLQTGFATPRLRCAQKDWAPSQINLQDAMFSVNCVQGRREKLWGRAAAAQRSQLSGAAIPRQH